MQIHKRLLTAFGTAFLAFTLLISPGLASASSTPAITLEQAIQEVKSNFNISPSYQNFYSSYEDQFGQAAWTLTWQASEAPYGEFRASVAADTGIIIQVNNWGDDSSGNQDRSDRISRYQAQSQAEALVQRVLPEYLNRLQYHEETGGLNPLDSAGPVIYTFNWQRLENGVPFPDNGAMIQIRSSDSRLVSYSFTWSKATLPSPDGVIGLNQARSSFAGSDILELQYFVPGSIKPLATAARRSPILVYRAGAHSAIAIDAFSGEPVRGSSRYVPWGDGAGGGSDLGNAKDEIAPPLTPVEEKDVKNIESAITRDQAIGAVKRWFAIPENMSLIQSNLVRDGSTGNSLIWSLAWQDKANQGTWLNAQVNARSGEVNYYSRDSAPRSGSAGMNRQEARILVEGFLKDIQSGHWADFEFDNSNHTQPVSNNPIYYFNYHRVVQGIPFPANRIGVGFNTIDKSIVSYEYNWQDYNFPPASGIMNKQQITSAYLAEQPLTLSYGLYQDEGKTGPGQEKVLLVYQPQYSLARPRADLLDARAGKGLDWQGKPINSIRVYVFNDIQGHWAEQDLATVGEAGLFGEYGSSFHPDEAVTVQSLFSNMLKASDLYFSLEGPEILREARNRGWLKEDLALNQTVSRELLARIMIRYLGLEKAAQVQGIFQVPYKDAASLSPNVLGYVALSFGLGIMRGDGISFSASQEVSRAEAAAALVRSARIR